MADSSIEIDNLVGKDKLLNLTTNKAKELNFSDGTMNSRQEIYEDLGLSAVNEIITVRSF